MAVNSYKEDEQLEGIGKKETLRRLFSYLSQYKLQVLGVMGCMAITVVVSLANPLIIEKAIDVYIANKDMQGLFRLAAITVAINVEIGRASCRERVSHQV